MSHIHAGPHVHAAGECTYEYDGFGVHLYCSDPSEAGGPCHDCTLRLAEQLSETGRFPSTTINQKDGADDE